MDGSRIPCCPVDNSSKNNKKTHSENFPLEDNSWNTATANGRYSVGGKMNFLIKIHIGLFVYGLFIKAARIFGVYSVETDIFGNYFHFFFPVRCVGFGRSIFDVDYSAQQSLCCACRERPLRLADYVDWQIFPLLISNNTTLRFEITPERERGKEIIAFASFYFFFGL